VGRQSVGQLCAAALAIAAATCGSSAAAASPTGPACACLPHAPPGVVWRGPDPHMTLDDIAHLVAPILWFSSDEPLLLPGNAPIPGAHPCDKPASTPIVYYGATRIHLRNHGHVRAPVETDPEFFAKVETVIIRFYFYYPRDVGFSAHPHDLEVAEFHVRLDDAGGCGQVRVEEVIGFAHAVDWYFNRLRVTSDTRFPITLFVEEGKHASCPDRNADGVYTPGYDVNRRVNDAWGVRDVLAAGFLGSAPYSSSMTKPRTPEFRMMPPPADLDCVTEQRSSWKGGEGALGYYELRPASAVSASACPKDLVERADVVATMKGNLFGAEHPPKQNPNPIAENFADPVQLVQRFIPSIALRYDQKLGLSFTLPGFDLRLFYIVPKVNIIFRGRYSFEALFTNSAARIYSPYFTAGAGREPSGDGFAWRFAAEIGMRFRYRLSGWKRVFGLGYHFAGVRFGLRASGFNSVNDFRFIVEFGAGSW
jgi:hypothetical protein